MSDERTAPTGRSHELRGLRYLLAAVCFGAYVCLLLAWAQMVRAEPLRPLRDVGLTVLCMCAIFVLCLGSVAIFTRLRNEAQRRQGGGQR